MENTSNGSGGWRPVLIITLVAVAALTLLKLFM